MHLLISEFSDEHDVRTARVIETDRGYTVEMWENFRLVEARELESHSVNDAEDYAEDWVLRA